MEREAMERAKEEHITEVFGIVVVRRYVIVHEDKKGEQEIDSSNENLTHVNKTYKQEFTVSLIIILIHFLLMFGYLLYNPPQIVDNFINVIIRSCPEKTQLDEVRRNVEQCQSNLETTSDNLSGCSEKKTELENDLKISSNEKEATEEKLIKGESKISSLENSLVEARGSIASLEKKENDLQSNITSLTEENDNLQNKVDETEMFVGKCRNKNMDHEIEKSELLRKLQKAEKELKNCH